jgi:type IV pilus assembly protein PilF
MMRMLLTRHVENKVRQQWAGWGRCVLVSILAMTLNACVTETTGGFNVERSDTEAFNNYLKLAEGYLEQNDLGNTKRHLANASAINPSHTEIFAIWGLVYEREGETKLAADNFEKALRLDAGNSKARNNYAAFLFASNDADGAYKQLLRVVDDTDYEGRAQGFENLGLAALRLNRSDDAKVAFERALQLNANLLRSTVELCSLSIDANDIPQALNYYRKYANLLQFYRTTPTARTLWLGVKIEAALGNQENVKALGEQLEARFASAPEVQLYRDLMAQQK